MAQALGVSQATVVNAVQRLGYRGFADCRRALIAERALEHARGAASLPPPRPSGDPLLALARRVFDEDIELLKETATLTLLGDGFRSAVTLLEGAPQVVCIGAELSGVMARLAAGTFKQYGIRATAEDHTTEQLALVDVADPATALLAISYRGINRQLTAVAERARERGMPVIALTNSPTARLARAANVVLLTAGPVLPDELHPNQTGARGAQHTMVRALAEAIAALRSEAPASVPELAQAHATPGITTPHTQ